MRAYEVAWIILPAFGAGNWGSNPYKPTISGRPPMGVVLAGRFA